MHEALRHHTLLQLKTVGNRPTAGLDLSGNNPKDKLRGGTDDSMTLRNLIAGSRVFGDSRRTLDNDNGTSLNNCNTPVTDNTRPFVTEAIDIDLCEKAETDPSYLDMFTSPMSAVQRLMAELLIAADEFRRMDISSGASDVTENNKTHNVTAVSDNLLCVLCNILILF